MVASLMNSINTFADIAVSGWQTNVIGDTNSIWYWTSVIFVGAVGLTLCKWKIQIGFVYLLVYIFFSGIKFCSYQVINDIFALTAFHACFVGRHLNFRSSFSVRKFACKCTSMPNCGCWYIYSDNNILSMCCVCLKGKPLKE